MSTSSQSLQDGPSIEEFFNVVVTEALAQFEYLEFEFLTEFDVFAPSKRGRKRGHHPPELFRAFLHCYYNDIYGIRPVTRELQNTLVWLSCGFDSPPSFQPNGGCWSIQRHLPTLLKCSNTTSDDYLDQLQSPWDGIHSSSIL
jgi:hypothetical protein